MYHAGREIKQQEIFWRLFLMTKPKYHHEGVMLD